MRARFRGKDLYGYRRTERAYDISTVTKGLITGQLLKNSTYTIHSTYPIYAENVSRIETMHASERVFVCVQQTTQIVGRKIANVTCYHLREN